MGTARARADNASVAYALKTLSALNKVSRPISVSFLQATLASGGSESSFELAMPAFRGLESSLCLAMTVFEVLECDFPPTLSPLRKNPTRWDFYGSYSLQGMGGACCAPDFSPWPFLLSFTGVARTIA